MRERQRRSITTNIFHGLRKHGGYRLSPRADINEVLRHLAQEAGWIIDPDGTTFRSPTFSNGSNMSCPMCGAGRKSGLPTPSSSYLGGGDCSTTASPRHESAINNLSSGEIPAGSTMASNEGILAVYMCGGSPPNGGGALELDTADS
ncbi:Beta-amylase 7 [Striga hermonthica]|uniref:Protein BZR1 homolog n=1 Tax=Striga hermonthica TaxID=68872 RepID=A0A9N7RJP5_STRHE|nr:Beta-amylase 7 [Striga hermonthica]